MPRFLKWDFDHNLAIEYERLGECNGCGMCCTDKIKYTHAGRMTEGPGPMGDKVIPRGVWSEYQEGDQHRFISLPKRTGVHAPCLMLNAGHCMVHANKSMQETTLCWAWPIIPEHVALFNKCSYTFKEVNRWAITKV